MFPFLQEAWKELTDQAPAAGALATWYVIPALTFPIYLTFVSPAIFDAKQKAWSTAVMPTSCSPMAPSAARVYQQAQQKSLDDFISGGGTYYDWIMKMYPQRVPKQKKPKTLNPPPPPSVKPPDFTPPPGTEIRPGTGPKPPKPPTRKGGGFQQVIFITRNAPGDQFRTLKR